MLRRPCVALVGGGIGGLTAQVALTRAGIEAHLFEEAAELKEVGAGIGLSANAMKVLRALGLENTLRERGFEPRASVGRDWRSARTQFRVPLMEARSARFGAPHLNMHRADLLAILAAAVPRVASTSGAGASAFHRPTTGRSSRSRMALRWRLILLSAATAFALSFAMPFTELTHLASPAI